ncbi:hypothetical protein EMIT0158MI4_90197 [Burkholderia ambifaria]
MALLIQIAPGLLFSSDVLSPEWGRKCHGNNRPTDIGTLPNMPAPMTTAEPEVDYRTQKAKNGQLSLL